MQFFVSFTLAKMKPMLLKKKLAYFGIAILIIGSVFGIFVDKAKAETAWNAMPTTGFDAQVNGVSAVSEIAVWAVGDDDDASGQLSFFDGWDWTEQTIPVPAEQELNDISMASATIGVAVGDTNATRGVILYTSDGGTNWTQSADGDIPDVDLYGVCMASTSVGWAVGDSDGAGNETLLYTSDGGVNWADQGNAGLGDPDLNDVDATSTTVAVVVGESDGANGMIRYTGNGGTNWTQRVDVDIPDLGLNGVYVADADNAFVVGDDDGVGGPGTILYTIDLSNDDWDISADGDIPLLPLHGVDGTSTTRVWVGGESDSMIETSDGTDWEVDVAPANSDTIRRLSAESADHIYGACSGTNYVIASFDIAGHDVQFDLGVGISVELDSTAAYDFGTVIPEVVYTSAANVRNVTVKTNNTAGWILYIKGTGAFEDTSLNTVNLNVLEWSEDAAAWTDTSTTDTQVASNGSATSAAGVTTGMEYRLNTVPYGISTDGTDFVTTITYTAVTQ